VIGCGGTAAVQCRWGEGCVCLQCPAGQEPSKVTEDVKCQFCPPGSFSDTVDSELCRPHTSCEILGRNVSVSGTLTSDAVCGDCLPGKVRTVGKGSSSGTGGPANSTVVRSAEEKTAEYAVFALVPVFCIMGLLGILICNILKKKGYNCTAEKEGRDEETATPQKEGHNCPYISDDLNEDTISVLVRLITEKKENAAALEELLLEYESKQMSKGSSIKFPMLSPLSTFRSIPKSCPHQSHLHTISGLSGLAPKHGYRCSRCAQRKWPPVLIPPLDSLKDPLKPPQGLILPSLDTPVDQFQVAHIPEYKPVTTETKTSSQEQRNSLFGGKHFSSCSSSGFRRYGHKNSHHVSSLSF
uniref:TNFR-Cys domain-containing protein n=1 Tax=Poecilia mexicana TaxID=48701 RepID=A0A3B3XE14_9TELE